jgi:hypothetical protein
MDDDSHHQMAHPGLHENEICNSRRFEGRTRSSGSSRSNDRYNLNSKIFDSSCFRNIGPIIKICQLNIEGISKDKCDYLAKLAKKMEIDVIVLQETHTGTEEQLHSRGLISGYILVDHLCSSIYGLATYVRENLSNYEKVEKKVVNDVHLIDIKIGDTHIINIYKPPNARWPDILNLNCQHPAIFIGDFNCHNNQWGYADNDENGELLLRWAESHNLHLIFDAKDRKSFHSARWQRDYNPDLCFVTSNNNDEPLRTSRCVLNDFPHSQHRPVLITVGIQIPLSHTIQKPRWNFQKADWKTFRNQVEQTVRWIPPTSNNYQRFVGAIKSAAKKFIPRGFRKEYTTCWSSTTNNLFDKYQKSPNIDTADELLKSLNNSRKEKWNKLMENMNFTHSSRSCWSLLRKLGAANETTRSKSNISPNSVASRLVNVSNSIKLNKREIRNMKRKLYKQRKSALTSEILSRPFSVEEMQEVGKTLKNRKAAGFDGIYPEFIKHLGPIGLNWLRSFFNDIVSTGKIPNEFKKAKVIAILKPGKPANEASSYRPISLLSVCHKFLEKLIYNRISPIIEEHLPIEQAGFRPNRNCCDQVLALTSYIESGFQKRLKTGVVFVDLTAAYDTVWKNSAHVNKIDAQLNTTLRIITGTLKSTPTPWLHVLAHIIPYDIRRKYVTKRIWDKFQNSPNMYSITQDMANLPPFRLKSRKPLWKEEFLMEPFSKSDYWKAAWQDVDIFNKNLIEDPTKQLPGFDLPRKIWCKLNRFRTGHGKCNNMLFHWNIRENPSCECGAEKETIQHILEECPLTKFQQGFSKLHLLTEDALNWLQQIKNI